MSDKQSLHLFSTSVLLTILTCLVFSKLFYCSRNATRGAKNKSLATVAEKHIVKCALLKSKLEMHESGTYKGGHCPNQRQKHTVTFRRQRDRAAQFAKELEAGDINPRLHSTSSFVDPSSSHRAPKRTGISTSDDIGALSASSSSENESTQAEGQKTAKASFRKRKGRSKVFQKSLSMAKRTKSVTLTQIYDAGPTRKVFELLDGGRIRLVEISETPLVTVAWSLPETYACMSYGSC